MVAIEYSRHHRYTMIHVSAFIVVGTIAALLAAPEVEVAPHTFYPVVVLFAIFRVRGSTSPWQCSRQPLLGSLAWWNVSIGNAIAAYGMGYYLGGSIPRSRDASSCIRWGETDEGE